MGGKVSFILFYYYNDRTKWLERNNDENVGNIYSFFPRLK